MSMVSLHCAYSSLENRHSGTSLLAWYLSARIILRQRTPRAFSSFIERQCWRPKELPVCSVCQWPWSPCKRPAIRNPRFSSLSLALGQWVSWELMGKHALSTKEQKSHFNIALLELSERTLCDWGTGGNGEKSNRAPAVSSAIHNTTLQVGRWTLYKEQTVLNLPNVEKYCHAVSEV